MRETFCCSRRPRGAPLELPANLRSMVGSSASRAAMAFLPAQLRDRVQQQIRTVPAVQVSPAQPKMPRQSGNPAGKEEEMPANIAPEEKEVKSTTNFLIIRIK